VRALETIERWHVRSSRAGRIAENMHALSVRQPYAESIAEGWKNREYRTWAPNVIVGRDLLIVASKTPGDDYAGEPQGVAICIVRVTKITGSEGDYAWHLDNARRVAPTPIKGCAALWIVPDEKIVTVPGALIVPRHGAHKATIVPARRGPRTTSGPYTFSIEDDAIRGASAKTPDAARALARELAAKHGTTITIFRDGLAIGGEG
jgi:hypothetical protein